MHSSYKYRYFKFILLFFIAVFFTASGVFALDVPKLKGRVNDYAGVLSASTEKNLDAALSSLERTDSTQIVVLTIPSLKGDSLEDFSLRVAEEWMIGQKEYDNGALLLVSKNDRKLRIEVGYGLEGKMTDLISGRIIRDIIIPHFKSGNYDRGVSDGVQAMIAVVKGEFKETSKPKSSSRDSGSSAFPFIIFVIIILINFFSRFRRDGRHGRGSGLGWFIVGAALSGGRRSGGFGGSGGFSGGGGGFGGGGSSGSW